MCILEFPKCQLSRVCVSRSKKKIRDQGLKGILKTAMVTLSHFIRTRWGCMRATCEPDPIPEMAMRDAIKNAPFQPYEIHSNNNKNLIHMEKKSPDFFHDRG